MTDDRKVSERVSEPVVDYVNDPPHYTNGDIECIDAIKASMSTEAFRGFLKGNAMKYLWRYELKCNPVTDLKKGIWYMNKLVESINQDYESN